MILMRYILYAVVIFFWGPSQAHSNPFVDDDFGAGGGGFSLDDYKFDDEFIEFDTLDSLGDNAMRRGRFDGDWGIGDDNLAADDPWAPLDLPDNGVGLIDFGDNDDPIADEIMSPVAAPPPEPRQKATAPSPAARPAAAQPAPTPPALSTNVPASSFDAFEPFQASEPTSAAPLLMYDPVNTPYAPLPPPDRPRYFPPLIAPNEFGGAAAIPDSRRTMAVGEAPEEYLVRPGDTLFDICDQLIDEADYWPKLWALNPEIKNPHFIYPGMRLRFFPGDDETPPYLQVIGEDDIVPMDMYGLGGRGILAEEMADLLFEDFTLRATEVGYAEEISLPGSFDDLVDVGTFFNPSAVSVILPGFIYSEQQQGLAVSLGGASGLALVGPREDVVFQARENLQPGTTYTILRSSGRINHPRSGRFFGYRYEFVANVRITRDLGDLYYQGTPVLSRLGVQDGDLLVTYRSTQRNVSVAGGSLTGGDGVILGFDYPGQHLGGEGSLVFISERFPAGSVLPVFQMLNERALGSFRPKLPEADEQVGVIRIIEAAEGFSTGYVLKNTKGIRLGDLIGRG